MCRHQGQTGSRKCETESQVGKWQLAYDWLNRLDAKTCHFSAALAAKLKETLPNLNWDAKQRKNCSNLRKFELANYERKYKLLQVQTKLRSHKSTQLMKTCFYLRRRLAGTS